MIGAAVPVFQTGRVSATHPPFKCHLLKIDGWSGSPYRDNDAPMPDDTVARSGRAAGCDAVGGLTSRYSYGTAQPVSSKQGRAMTPICTAAVISGQFSKKRSFKPFCQSAASFTPLSGSGGAARIDGGRPPFQTVGEQSPASSNIIFEDQLWHNLQAQPWREGASIAPANWLCRPMMLNMPTLPSHHDCSAIHAITCRASVPFRHTYRAYTSLSPEPPITAGRHNRWRQKG